MIGEIISDLHNDFSFFVPGKLLIRAGGIGRREIRRFE
jgi:hypothetical protein